MSLEAHKCMTSPRIKWLVYDLTTSMSLMTLCSAQEYFPSSSKEVDHAPPNLSLQETPSVPLPLALKHTQTHSTLSQVSVCMTVTQVKPWQ